MVVTGKGYGSTNLIVLDRSGNVLMQRTVQVQGPRDVVVMYRGATRETYSCTPKCERRVTLGDAPGYFDEINNEGLNRSGSAAGAAPSSPTMSVPPPPVTLAIPTR
jgi:hypothetical protein